MFSAVACCYSYDLSFPVTFYDFDQIDQEFGGLDNRSRASHSWATKQPVAYFRGPFDALLFLS